MKKNSGTFFAPAKRADSAEIKKQAELFQNNEALNEVGNAVSQMLVVLNQYRQIIYANKHYLQFIGLKTCEEVIGKRVGEAINCVHAFDLEGGCGTTEFCRKCGAVNAIIESHSGKQSVQECRILTYDNDALNLQVTATPFYRKNEMFTIFAISDVSNEKRKNALERIFFHDVLNSAGGISGMSTILQEIKDKDEMLEVAQTINRAADNLINEIQTQRQLSAAERGDLNLHLTEHESISILKDVSELYQNHETNNRNEIRIDSQSDNVRITTDVTILRRIIGNMVKNALEASLPGSPVRLSCHSKNRKVRFSVSNENYMEKDIQLQLFKRSFSTKGIDRGTGTYSMKLLGEKYLKGKVGFETSRESGTTFYIEIANDFKVE
jgi:K+-sensing histidine kinase KdpD